MLELRVIFRLHFDLPTSPRAGCRRPPGRILPLSIKVWRVTEGTGA